MMSEAIPREISSSFISKNKSITEDLDLHEEQQDLTQQQNEHYEIYQNLIHHPEIWKMVIDAKDHKYGKNSYDKVREDNVKFISNGESKNDYVPGEEGYLKNMLEAFNYMLDTLGQPMTPNEYIKFHDLAVSGVQGMASNLKGFRKTGQGSFYISVIEPCNMSKEGFKEWKQKKTLYGNPINLQ